MANVDKSNVAAILDDVGALLELAGEDAFRSRTYHSVARKIEALPGDIRTVLESGELAKVRGIGAGTVAKVKTILETGSLPLHEELLARVPPGLREMLGIAGLGPKRVRALHEHLGITTVEELRYACIESRLANLPGFGEKTQAKTLDGIAFLQRSRGSFHFHHAWEAGQALAAFLERLPAVERVSLAGSLRRRREVVKDVDLVAASDRPAGVMEALDTVPGIERFTLRGPTRASFVLEDGLGADLRVVRPIEFPFALHYFTGSKEHNVRVRGLAREKGLTLNEYTLKKGSRSLACADEEALFARLGLAYIPPELREGTDEVEHAAAGDLPELVTEADVAGLFHCHTVFSDGLMTLEELAAAAVAEGMTYVGVSDHSKSSTIANGMKEATVRRQWEEIDACNRKLRGIRLLKGIEVDILPDGSLDYDDDLLAGFEFVIASVHSHFGLSRERMTERVLRAVAHPRVTQLGHPTGRLLLGREGFAIDMERVIDTAAERGVVIEINASPYRLDLDWRWGRRAREKGLRVAINPDAHHASDVSHWRYGVGIARKAGFTRADVLNAAAP